MDATLYKKDNSYFIFFITAIAAVGGFLFGFDTGIISGALMFIEKSFRVSTLEKEIIVSSVIFGAFTGSIMSGQMADLYGRKKMLILAAITFIIGTTISTFAWTILVLIIGRLIIGLAIGIAAFTVPLFISEMAPSNKRGSLVLLNAVTITGGEAIAFIVDYALEPTQSWRMMFATGYIPAIALLIGIIFLPETPRWLVLKGKDNQARGVLQKIKSKDSASDEIRAIRENINETKGNWQTLFSTKLRPILIVGLGLGILQQFVGINTVMYYGPTIFKTAGFTNTSTQIFATFGMGIVNLIMSIVAVFIVDSINRKTLLISGMLIGAISLSLTGVLFHVQTPLKPWLITFFMITYISGYCLSLGSLFWLIISEIYPLQIRGLAMSFVAGIQWAANFLVAITFLSIINTIGASMTFWLYGLMCLVTIVFVYFFVPETNGVTLEQIESNLVACKASNELKKLAGEGESGV